MNNSFNKIDIDKKDRDITGWYTDIHDGPILIFMCWHDLVYGIYCEFYSDQTHKTIARFKQKNYEK